MPMRTITSSVLTSICLGAAMLLTGCGTIAGGHRVPDGSTQTRNYASIAGDVDVGRQANVGKVDTIAGDIEIGENSRVQSLDSIAGKIRLAAGVTVDGSVETIAGEIEIDRGCTITGSVESVAGDISITDSLVKGGIVIRRGDLEMVRTRVAGVIKVKWAKDKDEPTPRISIGPDSEVGEIVVDERITVRLRIHRSAKVGVVKGATAEYYD